MDHEVSFSGLNRDVAGYEMLGQQVDALLDGETDMIANLANVASVVMEFGRFHWVGFYLVKENELVLGPFQGPVACTRIAKGRGACGKAWNDGQTVVLANVHEFADHIACSPFSNSEIVIPVFDQGAVIGVFDIDSTELNDFKDTDIDGLQRIVKVLEEHL